MDYINAKTIDFITTYGGQIYPIYGGPELPQEVQ